MNPIQLKYDCPEKWENMKIGMISRHCTNCNKEVHDFTQFTREQIIDFLLKNEENQVCARVYKSQLDFSREEMLISINHIIRKNKNPNYALYLLAVSTFLLASCDNDIYTSNLQNKFEFYNDMQRHYFCKIKISDDSEHFKIIDSISNINKNQKSDDEFMTPPPPEENEIISNGIIVSDNFEKHLFFTNYDYTNFTLEENDENSIEFYPDVFPKCYYEKDEMTIINMQEFFNKYLIYPEWERKNKIEGIVILNFIVTKNGEIKNLFISNSIDKSKHINNEILRVFSKLRKWKAGTKNNQNVNVPMSIPFQFNLKSY